MRMSAPSTVTQYEQPEPDPTGGNGDGERRTDLRREDLITDQAVVKVEEDALDYMAFVRQLARLVAGADCPVNIALFGPWGSGKSTVGNLLRAEIECVAEEYRVVMPFVRYDAWRFAGLSLQRSFISEAAEGLGINREPYHRSLYQDRRTGSFQLRTLLRSLPAGLLTFALALAAIIGLATGLAALAAVVGGKEVAGELKRQAPTLLPIAGLIAIFTAIARPFIDAAGVQTSEGAPVAAEQFRLTFTRLIKDGLKRARRVRFRLYGATVPLWPLRRRPRRGRDRVVFFIDELDRCSPEDVVEALRALKTFLEVDNCVFVVAADRDVIEAALDRLPQTTPLNEEAPYFSSASSFLDKVFQYQISLPPLRGGRRLRSYARELVGKPEKGLWREIKDANNGRLLDDIVYTLIPSHVRSPRRVKVLLNRFAANARIAEAHQIVWMERAEEIAKLTVLQTEFPGVARDLRREPRLPGLLLRPPRQPSPALAELLERHDVGAGRDSGEIGSGARATSRLLAGAGRPTMVQTQRGELRRYLEHTATVPHVRRDLLFLETGGERIGLAEAQLMDEVETEAPLSPEKVAASVGCLKTERERRLVAEVLLDMSEMAVGREKRNIITALLETVDGLTEEVTQVADRVSTAIRIFRDNYDLPSELLAPALRISELQQARHPVELTGDLLIEGGLWTDRERVLSVLAVAGTLDETELRTIERSIERSVRKWPDIIAEAIRGGHEEDAIVAPMPREGVGHILGLPRVAAALSEAIDERDEAAGRKLAKELYDAGTRSLDQGEVSFTAIPLLANLRSPMVYRVVRDGSKDLEPHPGGPEARCSQALAALRHPAVDPHDWIRWLEDVERFDSTEERESRWAVEGMRTVLEDFRQARRIVDQEAATAVITAQAELAETAMDKHARAELVEAARKTLEWDWWDGPKKREVQRRLHAAMRALTLAEPEGTPVVEDEKPAEPLAERIWPLLEDDLRRALREAGGHTRELLPLVRELNADLPSKYSMRVSEEIERVATLGFDVDWAERFQQWLRGLAAIGADEAAVAALSERASVERLRGALDPAQFAPVAERLKPLIEAEPTATVVAQVAIAVAEGLGAAGERFSRQLLQAIAPAHSEALVGVTGEAAEGGSGPADQLRTAVAQAAGRSLLDGSRGLSAKNGLLVARPEDLVSDRLTADIVLVGSGAAGGVLAHRLAQAGRRVLVLERGHLVDPATLPDRAALVREALGDTRREKGIEVLQAQCVGGSTLISDGIPAPLPRSVLDQWHALGGPLKDLSLAKTFERLTSELALQLPVTVRESAEASEKALEARELTRVAGDTAPDRLSMLETLLLRAQQSTGFAPVEVLTDCRVERLEARARHVRRVRCRLSDGRALIVDADTVILAAGAIQSSAILKRSRLGGPAVGRSLHFNLTALLLAEFQTDEHRDRVRYFESMERGYVSLTRAADARGTVAGMPGWFEDVAQGRSGEGGWTVSAVTVASTRAAQIQVPEGSRSRSRIVFQPGEDVKRLITALEHVGAEAFRNKARRVRPATHRPLDIRRSALADLGRLITPRDLVLTSGQPLGGNPMGDESSGGVVDEHFRVYGTENLFVCDASVLPTATTVYPQLTIMALADQAARRVVAKPDEGRRGGPSRLRSWRRGPGPAPQVKTS